MVVAGYGERSAQMSLTVRSNLHEAAAVGQGNMGPTLQAARVACEWPKGAALGECPVWDERAGMLVWVDIFGCVINVFDPVRVRVKAYKMPWLVGSVGLREAGGYVVAKVNGFALLDEECKVQWEIDVTTGLRWRFNDGKPDPQGNFWAGAMRADVAHGAARTFVLTPDLQVAEVARTSSLPNGLAWVDQGRSLLYIDSAERSLAIYDCELAGLASQLGPPRVVYRWGLDEGVPDGLSVDSNGSIWVSIWGKGKVVRLTLEGVLEESVHVPPVQPTSIAFGGNDLCTAFVTSAACDGYSASSVVDPVHGGGLFSFQVDTPGVIANRFAG